MNAEFSRIGHFARWEPALRLLAAGSVVALTGLVFWRLARRDGSVGSPAEDIVDQSSEDSFPASDPPAFNARGPG
jgi:hypothetical protein